MENKEIATVPDSGKAVGIPDPAGVLAVAVNAAKVLTQVVCQKKHPVMMAGEQYLEYEDWQTLGQFYGVTAITGEAVAVDIGGVKGAKATAKLVDFRTGEVVGGAEAYCMRDEPKWNTRTVYEWQGEGDDRKKVRVGEEPVPWFQLASMAQTRAGAKALRNRLAWIAVLAGYRPTPAEELTGTEQPSKRERTTEHWCEAHKTNWFKSGKMKTFAHPYKDDQGEQQWCNEPVSPYQKPTDETKEAAKTEVKAPAPTQQAGQAPKVATEATPAQDKAIESVWPKGIDGTKIKDGTDLAIFAGKHGVPIDKFRTVLGVTKPQDVTNVREAAHKLFPDGIAELRKP